MMLKSKKSRNGYNMLLSNRLMRINKSKWKNLEDKQNSINKRNASKMKKTESLGRKIKQILVYTSSNN